MTKKIKRKLREPFDMVYVYECFTEAADALELARRHLAMRRAARNTVLSIEKVVEDLRGACTVLKEHSKKFEMKI